VIRIKAEIQHFYRPNGQTYETNKEEIPVAKQTETMEINGVEQAVTLDLALTTKPVEGGIEVQCIVTLGSKIGRQQSKPFRDSPIEFTANNEPWCALVTDEKGASKAVRVFEYGTYDIRARLVNTALSVREVCTAIAPEKKPPTKLLVSFHPQGHAAEYYLLIEAVGEKGGVPDWPVAVLEPNRPPALDTTKEYGAIPHCVRTDGPCHVIVSLLGTGLTTKIDLKGPLPSVVPPQSASSNLLPVLTVRR